MKFEFTFSTYLKPFRKVLCLAMALMGCTIALFGQAEWHSSSTQTGDGTSAVVAAPPDLAAGNLMIVGIMLEKGAGVTVSAPSGWNFIRSSNAVHNTSNTGTDFGMRTYWKIAVAGDVGANFTFGLSTSGKFTISNSRFSGFDPDSPIQAHNGMGSANNSTGVTVAPTVTTTANNTLVVAFFGVKKNAGVSALEAGLTQRHLRAGNDVTNMMATFVQGTAGATGNKSATFNQAEWRAGQQIAITTAPVVGCTAPEITAATNISGILNDAGLCSAEVTLDGSNISATGDPVIVYTYAIGMNAITSPHTFPVGTTTVTVTATNTCGSDEATFDVSVADNEAPVLTGSLPGGDTGNTCKSDAPTAPAEADIEAVYSDNCGTVTATFTGTSMIGNDCDWSVTYTYTVEDQYGNAASDALVTYTGADAEAPTLNGSLPGEDVGNVCKADAPPAPDESAIAALYSDNCGDVVVNLVDSDVDGDDCDWTATYTYSVQDECENAALNAVVTYTGGDTEAPVVITKDITIYLDEYGDATIPANAVDDGSYDNCSDDLTFSLSQTTFDCSNLNGVEVVLTVTDECGLSNTGTALVTVVLLPPVWQTSATAVGKGGSNPKVNKPSGTVAGDLLVIGLMIEKGTATTITPPSGWTLIRRTNQTTNVGMATYYKVATNSEPSNYTFSVTNSPKWAIGISRITGADPVNPVVIHNGASGGQVFNAVAPSITTTVCNSLVMAFYTNKKNATFTPASGTTERYDVPNHSEGLPSNMLATYVHGTAGATGSKTAVASQKEYWVAQQVAIRPAGGNANMGLSAPGIPGNIASLEYPGLLQGDVLTELHVYPNPTAGEVIIDLGGFEAPELDVTIFDLFGKNVFHQSFRSASRIELNLSDLTHGIYMISVDAAGQSLVKKLMINR